MVPWHLADCVEEAPWFQRLAKFTYGGEAHMRWQWFDLQYEAYDGAGPLAGAWARGTELDAAEWPAAGAVWSDVCDDGEGGDSDEFEGDEFEDDGFDGWD